MRILITVFNRVVNTGACFISAGRKAGNTYSHMPKALSLARDSP